MYLKIHSPQSLLKIKYKWLCFFALWQVPDEILVDRCVGRRLDPVTGKIYHIKSYPPESDEVKARLVIRPDDTEEKVFAFWTCYLLSQCLSNSIQLYLTMLFLLKVKARLKIYKQNSEAIISAYSDVMIKVLDHLHPSL